MSSCEGRDRVSALIIETLAESELELRERIADLEADLRTYRELALAAVDALHHMTRERDRLQERLRVLVADVQALRGVAA